MYRPSREGVPRLPHPKPRKTKRRRLHANPRTGRGNTGLPVPILPTLRFWATQGISCGRYGLWDTHGRSNLNGVRVG